MSKHQPRTPSPPTPSPARSRPNTSDSNDSFRSSRKRTNDEIYETAVKPQPETSRNKHRIDIVHTQSPPIMSPIHIDIHREPSESNAPPGSQPTNPDIQDPIDNVDQDLEPFDWEDLEKRFGAAMAKCSEDEQKLAQEAQDLFELFSIWMSVTPKHEDSRAMKRLKTRIAYVQHTEVTLEQKKQHYNQVVQAFQNALALLGNNM